MQRSKPLIRHIQPGILTIILLAVYLTSMAPGLTWANLGADGGDLIAAAATGGIAHPTGYPLYLLIARLFQFIPVGSLAFRTNLMSAVAAITAALLVNALVIRALSFSHVTLNRLAGLAAGLAFGLSPLLWSQAVITEVYALHALFVALLLFLCVNPISAHFSKKGRDCLLGLTFGLAMGNHVTTILILPVVLFTTVLHKTDNEQANRRLNNWQLDDSALFRQLAWIAVGLLVYITLPVRALTLPPVNWGNPVTLNGFVWLVSGKLYQGLLLNLSFSSVLERAQMVVSLLLQQFGISGLAVGLLGLIVFYKPTRLYYYMIWIAVATSAFAIGYATADAFLYLIPAFLCFAIWIGVGLGALMEVCSKRFPISGLIIGLVLILVLLIQAWKTWPHVDASHDQRAESFGRAVLSLAPTHAIVFAKGDEAVFTLWYFEYALRNRPDLAIVSTDLLQFKWYLQTLRSTYPDLNLPGPIPFTQTVVVANPERPVCYVQFIQVAEINCLPAGSSRTP